MSAEISLVTQLAIILIAAGIFTIISKALKQPLILGYIVAGFLVGPHLGLFPQFSPDDVHVWSELGIIFLLFGLGLEFNFKKLLNVGSAALVSALTICIGMLIVGVTTGSLMKWSMIESIFLGGMLSMSSTTIIIKAYDDLGIKQAQHSPLVFGLLVVEDLLAVLLMVLFSTIAVSNRFSGLDMLLSLGKLVSFLILCFLVGIFVIPTLLKRAKNYLSDEILLLISVGLCFLLVIIANYAGFSSAIGAFLMGSILSSTVEGESISKITVNIKNLFGAIFFVSVGMMVDPSVIVQYWPIILILTIVAMTGILIFSTAGVLLAGRSLDTALHVGFSLPQIGEFSFIIAGLGCSLGVLRDFIYPVIISVSVITTFTTPYMIKAADPVSGWLHRKLPVNVLNFLNKRANDESKKSGAEMNLFKEFLKKYSVRLIIYSLLIYVILLAAKDYLPVLAEKIMPNINLRLRNLIEVATTLLVLFPFLFGLTSTGPELKTIIRKLALKDQKMRLPIIAFTLLKINLAVIFILAAIQIFTEIPGWMTALIFNLFVILFLWRNIRTKSHSSLEDRFFSNLNAKENLERTKAPVASLMTKKMEGHDVKIEKVSVSPDFGLAGKKLSEMPFRSCSGANIIKIQRGSKNILIPNGDEMIMPGDILLAVGTEEQIQRFNEIMDENTVSVPAQKENFTVEEIVLDSNSSLTGKKLGETGMRASGCMVIEAQRNGRIVTNPNSDFIFEEGDIIWLAGLKDSIEWYK